MDEHFYNNEFEKFLQQQVKQHRMYPSDAVWKGIYKQMHGYKKWPGLYFVAILMIAALTVCTVFMESSPIVYPQIVAKMAVPAFDHLDPALVTNETLRNIGDNHPETVTGFAPVTFTQEQLPEAADHINTVAGNEPGGLNNNKFIASSEVPGVSQLPNATMANSTGNNDAAGVTSNATEEDAIQKTVTVNTKPAEEISTQQPAATAQKAIANIIPKVKKWQYQVYITPSTSYREIVDQKPLNDQFNGPMVTTYGVNASQVIRYKPGMGIEFGLGILYGLTERIKIKASLQYNIRQYNIEAYAGSSELAKIALIRGGYIDSVSTVARYRSTGGYNEALLLNKYHQVSLPVGVEYALVNGKKLGISIGGTVQPTYTFSQSSYLLTADYKSYADGTSMIRRWNVNSSLEATLSYKVGDFQWKLGPQLRYQHLPTYTDPYPIKEYLIDYGFKIGFTKTIK